MTNNIVGKDGMKVTISEFQYCNYVFKHKKGELGSKFLMCKVPCILASDLSYIFFVCSIVEKGSSIDISLVPELMIATVLKCSC